MGYAKEALIDKESVPKLPCGCRPQMYYGAQHVYALCRHGNYILDSYYCWEKLGKQQRWVGPAQHDCNE